MTKGLRQTLSLLAKFVNSFTTQANVVAGCGLIVMTLITTYEVIARYVFNSPTFWSLEIATYLLLLCYLAMASAIRKDAHPKAELVVARVPERARWVIRIVTSVLAFSALSVFIWQGWEKMMQISHFGEKATGLLSVPLVLVVWIIPVGGALFLLQWIVIVKTYVDHLRGRSPESKRAGE